jgi:hypothetical protein
VKTFEFKGRVYCQDPKPGQRSYEPMPIRSLGPVVKRVRKWRVVPNYWDAGRFRILKLHKGRWKVWGWSRYKSIAEAMKAIRQAVE